jgi:hypothetical protein
MINFFHSFQQESIVITGTDNDANTAIICRRPIRPPFTH